MITRCHKSQLFPPLVLFLLAPIALKLKGGKITNYITLHLKNLTLGGAHTKQKNNDLRKLEARWSQQEQSKLMASTLKLYWCCFYIHAMHKRKFKNASKWLHQKCNIYTRQSDEVLAYFPFEKLQGVQFTSSKGLPEVCREEILKKKIVNSQGLAVVTYIIWSSNNWN